MPAPKPLVALVALVDAVLVTLKSLTTVRAVLPSVRPSVLPPPPSLPPSPSLTALLAPPGSFSSSSPLASAPASSTAWPGTYDVNKDAQSYDTTLSLTSTNSLLLKAALAQGSSSGPRPAPPPRPRNIAVPRDGSSTLNYLYTPGVEQVEQVEQVEPVADVEGWTPLARDSKDQATFHQTHQHHLPARMSLTESIKVWIWLTVDIAFDIPRYLLGTTSHPLPAHKNTQLQSIVQMENSVTTSSVIRAAGYPLEEHAVTTSDGYVLTMQRLPQRNANKVVFFMHGVLDTSLGWVCNGPIGSHAFTAHDSGADVWLGNCRANEGVGSKRRGPAPSDYLRYWAYSINELGLNDVEGMLRYISSTVCAGDAGCAAGKELHIVAHSLGAASVLIHLVFRAPSADSSSSPAPLPIKQVILLAPAGFHSRAPFLALPFMYTVPPVMRLANGLMGAFHAQYGLPAYVCRFVLFCSPLLCSTPTRPTGPTRPTRQTAATFRASCSGPWPSSSRRTSTACPPSTSCRFHCSVFCSTGIAATGTGPCRCRTTPPSPCRPSRSTPAPI